MNRNDSTTARKVILRNNSRVIGLAIVLWVNLIITYIYMNNIGVVLSDKAIQTLYEIYTFNCLANNTILVITAVIMPIVLVIANIWISSCMCGDIIWEASLDINISNILWSIAKCAFWSAALCSILYLLLYIVALLNLVIITR